MHRPLRILTYNIAGHMALYSTQHLPRIAEVILAAEPDVVGLQEVHGRTWKARFTDQLAVLARITGMNAAFGPSFTLFGGGFGNAVLTRGEIRTAAVHPLPGFGEQRSVFETEIILDGAPLSFYVAHLAAYGSLLRRSRRKQVAGMADVVSHAPHPGVLVGDFNAAPNAPELRPLFEQDRLLACGEAFPGTHKVSRRHWDYVFADRSWETIRTEVLRRGPSDHWPLLAEIRRR